jgi:hypothetical protein
MDGQPAVYAVRITVRNGDAEPEILEFPRARVTARPGRDLVIVRRWGRVLRRFRAGQWTGYDFEVVYDRRRDIRRRRRGRRTEDDR